MKDKTLAALQQAADEASLQVLAKVIARAQEILNAAPATFDEFWKLYPRKVGKPAAFNAFKRLNCDKHFPTIKADVLSRLASKGWEPTATGMHFIPHPTTYLNQARWLDSPTPKARDSWSV